MMTNPTMPTLHVMIDLETLSTRSNAAILSIGAVKFNPLDTPGALGDPDDEEYQHFYQAVDLTNAMSQGHVDGDTVRWWLQQSEEARKAIYMARVDATLQSALNEFMIWFGPNSLPTWGNGSAFDCVVLRNAYMASGVYPPYTFRDERCFRTVRNVLPEIEYVAPKLAHHALEDAVAQAVHLQKLFAQLNHKG